MTTPQNYLTARLTEDLPTAYLSAWNQLAHPSVYNNYDWLTARSRYIAGIRKFVLITQSDDDTLVAGFPCYLVGGDSHPGYDPIAVLTDREFTDCLAADGEGQAADVSRLACHLRESAPHLRPAMSATSPGRAGGISYRKGISACLARRATELAVEAVEQAALAAGQRRRFWEDFRIGWKEITRRGWYCFNLIMHAIWNLGAAVFFVLGPVMMARHYGGSTAWGITLTAISVGSVIGGVATARIRGRRTVVIANASGMLVAAPLMLLAGVAPLYLIAASGAVAYAGAGLLDGVWRSMVQQLIPLDVLSRATATNWIISLIAVPVGYGLAGPSASAFGVGATLAGGAAIAATASALLVLWSWQAGATRLDSGIFAMHGS